MSEELDDRLRRYGRTIDEATEADLAERTAHTDEATRSSHSRQRHWRARPLVAGAVIAVVAAIAVIAVVASAQGPSDHVNVRGSSPTTPTTYYCDPNGGDTPTCPEEGPTPTPRQKTQYADWLREYPPADVARVRKIGFAGYPDGVIVSVLEAERGCVVIRSAWATAKTVSPSNRAAKVESIMRAELARLKERNWPPQSQMANIFQRLADQLASGDLGTFDKGRSLFEGECGHALGVSPSSTTSPSVIATTSPTVSSTPTRSAGVVARCQSAQLRLAQGVHVSEPTGQHTLSLTLTNISGSPCSVFGYPGIRIVDGDGRTLPFVYADHGDQVVSPRAPIPVTLASGAKAYITINKYRCDLGDKIIAGELNVTPPGDSDALSVALRPDGIGMNYCGPGDPGSKIYVSRAATSLNGTLAH